MCSVASHSWPTLFFSTFLQQFHIFEPSSTGPSSLIFADTSKCHLFVCSQARPRHRSEHAGAQLRGSALDEPGGGRSGTLWESPADMAAHRRLNSSLIAAISTAEALVPSPEPPCLSCRWSCAWPRSTWMRGGGGVTAMHRQVLALVGARLEAMNMVNLSTALHRLARLSRLEPPQHRATLQSDERLLQLLAACQPQLHVMPSRNLANCIWAVAALGVRPGKAWLSACTRAVAAAVPTYNGRAGLPHPSSPAAATALRGRCGRYLCALSQRRRCAPQAALTGTVWRRRQNVSNTLWALATLQCEVEPALLAALGRAFLVLLDQPETGCQSCANSVWVCASFL